MPAPVGVVTEAVFAGLARLRGARPFHPRGAAFSATLRPRAQSPFAFLGAAERPALVRLSNAAGAARAQDLLLSSSGQAPVVRHLLTPARGYDTTGYSTLLPYRHGRRLLLIGARYTGPRRTRPLRLDDLEAAARDGSLAFTLMASSPFGSWQPFGDLVVGDRLPRVDAQRLRFHPWTTAPELRPVGALNRLRAGAYEAAQRTATSE